MSKELAHCQARNTTLKKELETWQQNYEEEKNNHQNTQKTLNSLTKVHKADIEEHCRFLCLLHEQLQLATNSTSSGSADADLKSEPSWPLTSTPLKQSVPTDWTKLSNAVSTAALALCEALKQSKKEVKHLELTVSNLKSTLESTQATYKETTCKLTLNYEEQEHQWSQRNEEMKAHFEALLLEAESKAITLQQRLDDALQDVAQLTQSKQKVGDQLRQLRETHRTYKNDRACLLSCTCLLAGSLFPSLLRLQQLSLQKAILLKQLHESQKLHNDVINVVSSIQDDIGKHIVSCTDSSSNRQSQVSNSEQAQPHALLSLLRFRKVVIVVLAVRRLQTIRSENVLFRANFPRNASLFQIPVLLGLRDKRTTKSSPTANKSPPHSHTCTRPTVSHHVHAPKPSSKDLAGWMRSEKALMEVRESFTQLQSLLDSCTAQQVKGHGSRKERNSTKDPHRTAVLRPARSAFEVFLEKMASHFPHMGGLSSSSIICNESFLYLRLLPKSLCYHLAQGLAAILRNKPRPLQCYINSSEVRNAHYIQVHDSSEGLSLPEV